MWALVPESYLRLVQLDDDIMMDGGDDEEGGEDGD
jgi:hypothetical protein